MALPFLPINLLIGAVIQRISRLVRLGTAIAFHNSVIECPDSYVSEFLTLELVYAIVLR